VKNLQKFGWEKEREIPPIGWFVFKLAKSYLNLGVCLLNLLERPLVLELKKSPHKQFLLNVKESLALAQESFGDSITQADARLMNQFENQHSGSLTMTMLMHRLVLS
jgi:hypothetical protein